MILNRNIPKSAMVALLLGCAQASAETLDQLITEAQANNPELRLFTSGVASAKGGVVTARTFANPELSVGPGVRENVASNGPAKPGFNATFELNQLFLFPGKRALNIAIAERNVEISRVALEGFRFQIAAKVRQTFYELLAAQQIVALRKEQIQSAQIFVESARKRMESGYGSDFEVIKSQADYISANKALQQAEGRVINARVTLNILLGRVASSALEVCGVLEKAAPRGAAPDFLALAMARNPALRAQALQAQSAGLSLRLTRFGRRPDFSLGPAIEYSPNVGERVYAFRATVALPLWDQKRGPIETARAEEERALASIEKTRLEINGAVSSAAANLSIAKNQLALYTPEFLARLKEFVAQAEQSYGQNVTTLLIYLDAKRTYFDTLASYYESLGNVASSTASLESAVGVPLEFKP
jgi:cobalt-zinc-cadmium efflux system outer membrane protein